MKKINLVSKLSQNVGVYDLEIGRIVFYGLILFLYSKFSLFHYTDRLIDLYDPDFFFKWFSLPFPDDSWFFNLRKIWYLFLFFSMIGFITRISTWISFLLGFYILGLPWQLGALVHQTQCVVICLGIFCFAKCGKIFSVDYYLNRVSFWIENKPGISSLDKYRCNEEWVVGFLRINWCLVFFNAGLSKIKNISLGILSSQNFLNTLIISAGRRSVPDSALRLFLINNPEIGALLYSTVILLEVLCLGAVFYNEKLKGFFIFSVICMHIVAYYLVGVNFILMAPIYVFWIPWTKLFQKASGLRLQWKK